MINVFGKVDKTWEERIHITTSQWLFLTSFELSFFDIFGLNNTCSRKWQFSLGVKSVDRLSNGLWLLWQLLGFFSPPFALSQPCIFSRCHSFKQGISIIGFRRISILLISNKFCFEIKIILYHLGLMKIKLTLHKMENVQISGKKSFILMHLL